MPFIPDKKGFVSDKPIKKAPISQPNPLAALAVKFGIKLFGRGPEEAKEKAKKFIEKGAEFMGTKFFGQGIGLTIARTPILGDLFAPEVRGLEKRITNGTASIDELKAYADIYGNAPSNQQIIGSALKTGAGLLSAGKNPNVFLEGATTGMQAFLRGAITALPQGMVISGMTGFGDALEQEKSAQDIIDEGLTSTIVGGILSGVLGGVFARKQFLAPKKAEELKNKAIRAYQKGLRITRQKYREKATKIIPELLEENWWGTRQKLYDKAKQGLELTFEEYQKLGELQGTIQIQGLEDEIRNMMEKLETPTGRVISISKTKHNTLQNLLDDIKSLKGEINPTKEQLDRGLVFLKRDLINKFSVTGRNIPEMSKFIEGVDISQVKTIEDARDIIEYQIPQKYKNNPDVLKSIREAIETVDTQFFELDPKVRQQTLRELAKTYGGALYETRKAQKTIEESAKLSQLKKVDGAIRELLNTENPTYAQINKVHHLNSELYDILHETAEKEGWKKWLGFTRVVATATGVSAGAGVGGLKGAIIGGIVLPGVASIFESTWFNTLSATRKWQMAKKLMELPMKDLPRYISLLARGVPEVISDFTK